MTSRLDRDSISSLTYVNPPNNRNASGSTDAAKGFKKPPTVINTPSNKPGSNPYGANPNRRPQGTFGNPTSKGTLVSVGNSRHDDRATKRPRIDPGTSRQGNASSSINSRRLYGKPLLAPEPEFINVDDDDDEIEDTTPFRTSSDDLNLLSSRYFIPNAKQEPVTPRRASIVDDGPATKWLANNYAVDDDDPIEQFSEKDRQQSSSGIVKREVERINDILQEQGKPSTKWVDLAKTTRMKDKMRPKATKSAFSKTTENPQISDPLTTPTAFTSKKQKEENCLPVIEAFVGDHSYPDSSGQTLQLCLSTNHKLVLKVNDLEVWSLVMDTANCKQAQHSKEIPTFIVDPSDSTKLQVAIKFNYRHPQWDAKKYKEIQHGASGFKSREASNGHILWETVKRDRENSRANSPNMNGTAKLVRKETNVPRVGEKRKNSERSRSKSPPVQIVEPPGEVGPSKPMPPASKRSRQSIESGGDSVRRSSRNIALAKAAPSVDPDEVILVYPQGSPGAVNVTNGDLARLEPGEFLNDTLIEFGLKLWLKDLEETRPDLSKQIHIFSSFFYKKLNGKKDVAQAFETVRKWTSKIDIFEKKYIIVPINENVHWYLAIIYEPEHVLSPPAPQPTPKKQTRSSGKVPILDVEEETMLPVKIPIIDTEGMEEDDPNTFGETAESNMTPSEAEVEKDLNTDFQSSCNIGNNNNDNPLNGETDETRSSTGLSYVTEDGLSLSSPSSAISYLTEEGRAISASASSHLTEDGGPLPSSVLSPPLTEVHPSLLRSLSPVAARSAHNERKRRRTFSRMSVDMMVEDSTEETEPPLPEPEPAPASISAIASSQFYSRTKNCKGKRKANFDINPVISTGSSGDIVEIHEAPPKTYIFILDSLGTRHPQASKKLAKYLEMEAADKKGIDSPNRAQAKITYVPVQPNFCDCGVYLLHFAKIFMNNPTRYCQSILSQKGKSIPNKDRQDVWEDHRVADMREDIAKRIRDLSSVWKQERAIKERQLDVNNKAKMSDSDDEIDIVDSTVLKKKKNVGPANRPRG